MITLLLGSLKVITDVLHDLSCRFVQQRHADSISSSNLERHFYLKKYLFIMIYSMDFHRRVINIKVISVKVDSALTFQLRRSVASLCLFYSVPSCALSLTIPLRPDATVLWGQTRLKSLGRAPPFINSKDE